MEMYLKDIESTELKDTKSELVLPIVLKLLTKHNLKHWLRAGTTLGIFRDGKLIENDSDIDISILNDKFNFFDFLKDMESEGFEVIRHVCGDLQLNVDFLQ